MTFEQAVFYFFSTVTVFAAFMVVTVRHPVKAVLFLVLTFFSAASLWIMLEAEFLGIVLVLVYVGAVMVLFLFVVMMLDVDLARLREGFGEYLPIGGLVAVLLVLEMVIVLGADTFGPESMPAPVGQEAGYSNTRELGMLLYTTYLYPFEIAAAILLVAMVAAIVLTLRTRRKNIKYQNPSDQIKVRRKDRVRIVKMKSEKSS
ncbi:MAG: NADH-quinone oxidoreductase subunit J [Acidiferrobacterales bacterium]